MVKVKVTNKEELACLQHSVFVVVQGKRPFVNYLYTLRDWLPFSLFFFYLYPMATVVQQVPLVAGLQKYYQSYEQFPLLGPPGYRGGHRHARLPSVMLPLLCSC